MKILNLNDLTKKVQELKKARKKIVLCHGVFELIHPGHLRHFKEAKNHGDVLIVSISPDKFVNKGPGRPFFNENLRLESLSNLSTVDYVTLNTTPTAVNVIKKLRPNIYCKGPDYKNHKKDVSGEITNEVNAIKSVKGKIVYTKDITFSSSNLINKFYDLFSESQKKYINKIKKDFSFEQIRTQLEKLNKMRVLVIGETIIDEYVFCDALGKSGKEPILMSRNLNVEKYLGGAAAISRHISSFCKKLTLVTVLGEKKEYLNFIKSKLNKNISLKFINKKKSPTIVKRRYLDYISHSKIFGTYEMSDDQLDAAQEKKLSKLINNEIKNHDLVIVSDYGHGFISKKIATLLSSKSKYLALNAQINAANIGFHTMRNYKGVNCVIINEKELRHELRDRSSLIEMLMKKLSKDQKIDSLVVTQGKKGSVLYDAKKKSFEKCEAFAKKTMDKVGAGDTMLSIAAICLFSKMQNNLAMFISSLAAAHSVESLANKNIIDKKEILRSIENSLK
tara:strand:- start:1281 stop:2798 length:1518 start_codon:yes stop_codon:yes gene_type:complete